MSSNYAYIHWDGNSLSAVFQLVLSYQQKLKQIHVYISLTFTVKQLSFHIEIKGFNKQLKKKVLTIDVSYLRERQGVHVQKGRKSQTDLPYFGTNNFIYKCNSSRISLMIHIWNLPFMKNFRWYTDLFFWWYKFDCNFVPKPSICLVLFSFTLFWIYNSILISLHVIQQKHRNV